MRNVISEEKIIKKVKEYNPRADLDMVYKAFKFAQMHYKDRKRLSGEPFINHPFRVAIECAKLELDISTIVSAVLHTILKTDEVKPEVIYDEFGGEVGLIVEGMSSIQDVTQNVDTEQSTISESIKLLIASASDIRTLIIRLVDKLDDLRHGQHLDEAGKSRLITRIEKIYSPMADFIGLHYIKRELDDYLLKAREPKTYKRIRDILEKYSSREILEETVDSLKVMLNQNHIKYENIYAREKGIYSTYQKLKRYMSRGKLPDKELFTENNINRIYDRMGFAVLPYSVKDCYTVLALIHAQYERVSGEFDDYISNPKSSGYRALQTAVYLRPDDNKYIAEIQVKTPEMHKYNEYGPASHIAYKIKSFYKEDIDEDLYVFEDLQEWKEEISKDIDTDNQKFYLNIFDNNVFVFTKDGHIIRLEKGSTPLDFAYKIHTEVGDHCVGTKVNDKMVKFDYVLETGDVVEILTSKRKMVNRDWLGIVKENYTKQRIRRGITD